MRFIDYDKLHNAIYKKIIEYTPPALRDEYGRGYAEGLHRALYVIECQDKFTGWDDRKKLLQPEKTEIDWSLVYAMVNGLIDALPNEHEAHGDGWLQDWLKNFMWEYGIDPADLLMEEKDEGTDSV